MSEPDVTDPAVADGAELQPEPVQRQKSLTIGAVCKALQQEFPDISISKIRYLEDQKLLTPRRTPGGYRLYSPDRRLAPAHDPAAAARRVPAAAGDPPGAGGGPQRGRRAGRLAPGGLRRAAGRGAAAADLLAARQGRALLARGRRRGDRGRARGWWPSSRTTGSSPASCAGNVRYYDETEREIIRAVTELSRYGVAGRNLRVFKTSAERESGLLQQILAPSLRSRNPERRKEAVEALENLAAVASHLKHLLLVRDLRRIAK